MAAIAQAAESGQPVIKFIDGVPEEKANAVTRMVAAAAIIAAAEPAEGSSDDGDPLMLAFATLGAMPWSQRPEGPRTRSAQRHYPPVGLDRNEAQRALASTPKYPHVVLDGDGLDGNAIALVAAVMSALREAGIPDDDINGIPGEALSKDYNHVLRTITGMVTICWRNGRRRSSAPASASAGAKTPPTKDNLAVPPTQSVQPFVPIVYDRWEPPRLDEFLRQLRPHQGIPSGRRKAASKKILRVVSLDDLGDAAAMRLGCWHTARTPGGCTCAGWSSMKLARYGACLSASCG
jgi:hypothetical protein